MITVRADRFEIVVDDRTAGHTAYLDRGAERIFHHTEIDEEFSGRGLAGQVVEAALGQTAEAGKTVVAVCPYVRKWLEKNNPADITWRKPTMEELTWLKKELS
ncbi:N-acetyltransferase [Corynebacterium hylobatis]|uniref:N-acetyltransferase n=1 Tax=Corynebacterium hylobatis TaxID=1859290 RepID=A0A3R9ZZ22_9CORY|nr:GNAT family N-acetyltransferase [Corynebacterium hylobatis]RSZ62338.1 N-acetyltransferase [Corynebacterium hylobatis]